MMTRRLVLNGTWQLRWHDGQRGGAARLLFGESAHLRRALNASVPGEVHLDLMRAGLLEEPNTGLNVLKARWVEEMFWVYRRTFVVPRPAPGCRAYLVFDHLDYAATIYLNGKEAGRHANAFLPCRIDVTDLIEPGRNVLVVELESGLFAAADKPGSGYGLTADGRLQKRQWLRKVQSNFGWDWSPRLLNVGIPGGVYLDIVSLARADWISVAAELSDDLGAGSVVARVAACSIDGRRHAGALTVEIVGAGRKERTPVEIRPETQRLEVRVTAPRPEWWWPIGHGAPRRYEVKVTLDVEGRRVASATRQVGFRRVRVNQDAHPAGGRRFVIEINGKPVFVKGGNFVPADLIEARLDRARYAALVDRALEANFNMLRVWGGGFYESDDFYDECDRRGVLVWQEFIFACAKYPGFDEAFLDSVRAEAAHQVRRLAHHPSLIAWCGNNEMEQGNWTWGYDREVAHPDYAIFHLHLPRIVRKEDGTRYYQPSSPFSPDLAEPNADDTGDQHPWSIGFADTDFRKYRLMTCRFPNEGGLLGPTSLPTVRECLHRADDGRNSFGFEIHDNGIAYWNAHCQPDAMLEQWLGKHVEELSIEDYVYYGGIVQGEGLSEYVRAFRRRMFDSAAAIFWMFNDVWPCTRSWSIVDYHLRRTPSFHPVRRACLPLTVALAVEGGKVVVFGVNEGPEWSGDLRYGLFALAGGLPLDRTVRVTLPANASTAVAEFSLARWKRLGETAHGAFALLSRDGCDVARDRLFLPFFKDLRWPRARPRVRRRGGKAVFSSDVFAWRVCLDLDGEKALPDNFFDVFPGIPTVLDWPDALGSPRILRVGNLM